MAHRIGNADSSGDLAGQLAVVTGSSGGIGRAIALELARSGADVVVHGRTQAEAADEVAGAVRTLSRQAKVVMLDLAEVSAARALVDAAWQWQGRVDIWVNNAGADVLTGAAGEWSFEDKLEALWRVDVRATMLLSRLAGERMRAAGDGSIVNIGWDRAEQGMAGESGQMFGAVKGAVMAFTRSLAQSLAPQVRVNCVAPGWIRTAWAEGASEYWQERARRESLRGRWGTPDDVAHAVRFLASPAADFITGHVLPVSGGFRYGHADERQSS